MTHYEIYQQIDIQTDYENWRDEIYIDEQLENDNK